MNHRGISRSTMAGQCC
ncbi:hypothetical protein CFP56_039344 [Quercus suber]|uniref:Uncharacterized protein n=1 Tax=Quercus suber TaxID=58331 RepID=A0AAW0LN34_QUESU